MVATAMVAGLTENNERGTHRRSERIIELLSGKLLLRRETAAGWHVFPTRAAEPAAPHFGSGE
jgi:hypothetical protein